MAESVETEYKCPKCGRSFHTLTSYINHDTNEHASLDTPDGTIECPLCGSIFTSAGGLKRHDVRKHAASSKKGTSSKQAASPKKGTSSKQAASSKRHVCTDCQKEFASKRNLEDHKMVHNKDYSCNKCGESCNKLLDLCIHGTVTHESNNKPACFVCKEKLESNTNLKLHIINLHEEDIPRILDRAKFYCTRSSARNISDDDFPDSWESLDISEEDIKALKNEISAREMSIHVEPQAASTHNFDDPGFSQSQSNQSEIQRSSDDLFDSVAPLDISDKNLSLLDEISAEEKGMHVEPQKASTHVHHFEGPKFEQSQIHQDETARTLYKSQSFSSIRLGENVFSEDFSDLLAPLDISNEDVPILEDEPSARETSMQ